MRSGGAGGDELIGTGFGHLDEQLAARRDEREDLAAHAKSLAAEHRADVDVIAIEELLRDRIEDAVGACHCLLVLHRGNGSDGPRHCQRPVEP